MSQTVNMNRGTCEMCGREDVDLHMAAHPNPRSGLHKMICNDSHACFNAWSLAKGVQREGGKATSEPFERFGQALRESGDATRARMAEVTRQINESIERNRKAADGVGQPNPEHTKSPPTD